MSAHTDAQPPDSRERISLTPGGFGLRSLDQLSLHDVEALRLILRGGSVIDWHRMNLSGRDAALALIKNHDLDPEVDRAYLDHVRDEAVRYLRRTFQFAIPKPVQRASVEDLMLMASGKGHRQLCACTILKVIHIINHMAGRELLFRLPVSDRDLFHFVEEKVYRVVGTMLSEGFPITEFVGGRKNLDSTYTKLLSKPEATAAALYDKLRFRIVTRTKNDLLPVLNFLTENVFPYNYVVPAQSTNTIFHFLSFCQDHPHLEQMVERFQGDTDDELTPGDNRFSAPTYRVIHFVTDVPLRVPAHIMELAPPGIDDLGPIVYMLCEFQLLDAESEAANESGEASHDAYKGRQRAAVARRLRLGARAPKAGD